MRAPPFFYEKLPGRDYRKSPEQRWWEHSLEDLRHPQDPLTRGPGGERASPPPWAYHHHSPRSRRPDLRADVAKLVDGVNELRRMLQSMERAGGL